MSKMQYEVVGTTKGDDNEAGSIIAHESNAGLGYMAV